MINEVDNDNDDTEVSSICSDVFATVGHDIHELILFNDTNSQESRNSCSKGPIPVTWLLLDSQATIDVVSNGEFLTNIHHVKTTLHIRCNAGVKTTSMRGNLSGYGPVWYFPNGIANILSLSHVKEKCRVTYDSALDNTFYVHKPEKIIQFREAGRRLYYFDTADRAEECTTLVTTVDDNKSKLSAYNDTKAKLARDI